METRQRTKKSRYDPQKGHSLICCHQMLLICSQILASLLRTRFVQFVPSPSVSRGSKSSGRKPCYTMFGSRRILFLYIFSPVVHFLHCLSKMKAAPLAGVFSMWPVNTRIDSRLLARVFHCAIGLLLEFFSFQTGPTSKNPFQ